MALLGLSALICASLYAFATGAAAFAGERETGTLRLLDILPADRRVVWTAKVSFAVVTTLALTLLLLAMAALYTDRWKPEGSLSIWEALSFGMIVPVALGWGLFWSAILSNALTAAVTAIFCTAVSLSFLTNRLDDVFLSRVDLSTFVLYRVSPISGDRDRFGGDFRPVHALETATARVPVTHCGQPAGLDQPKACAAPGPVPGRRGAGATTCRGTSVDASATDHPPRRSWVAEARAMVWQTIKEGGKTWGLLAAIGLLNLACWLHSIATRSLARC